MADIKIRQHSECHGYNIETMIEVIGTDYINEGFIERVVGKLSQNGDGPELPAQPIIPQSGGSCRCRRIVSGGIDPSILKTAIAENRLDEVINPFDEIDIPIDDGGTVTVVCGYSDKHTARFILKDCWDDHVMNEENTNETGYWESDGRKHVLEDIYPHLTQEWKDIIKPRKIVEVIDDETVEYEDPMWLLSATDVFGLPEWKWWPDEVDSFQLPIFERERDRVKESGDNGTCYWWLRSVNATNTTNFCLVSTSGGASNNYAYYSLGFAPGFDI